VTHGVAVALLFGFAPDYVAHAIPDVWNIVDAKTVVNTRTQGADSTLRRILLDAWNSSEIERANSIAQEMIAQISFAGKPLAADDHLPPHPSFIPLPVEFFRLYGGEVATKPTLSDGILRSVLMASPVRILFKKGDRSGEFVTVRGYVLGVTEEFMQRC